MKFVLEDLPSNIPITELVDVIGTRRILKMYETQKGIDLFSSFFFSFTISEYRLIYRKKI